MKFYKVHDLLSKFKQQYTFKLEWIKKSIYKFDILWTKKMSLLESLALLRRLFQELIFI